MIDAQLAPFFSEHDLARLDAPLAEAEGLPGAVYGPDFFAIEQRRLFPRTWCAVTVGGRIPEPGDVLPVDLAGWPLLVVRQRDGTIAAFHNVCRHRGMQLVTEFRRGAAAVTCPWHAWTYTLDGALRVTPSVGGDRINHAEGFARGALGLKPVRIGRWRDYVLVNIDGAAPPIEDYTRPLDNLLAGIDMAGLRHAGSWTGAYPGNWKTAIEGGIEDYHLPWGHPQLVRGIAERHTRIDTGGCFAATSGRVVARETVPTEWAAMTAALPDLPFSPPADPQRSFVINLFPVGVLAVDVNHVMLGLFTPDGHARTRLEFDYYCPAAVLDDPAHAQAVRDVMDGWAFVAGQDTGFVAGVQRTAALRDAAGIATRFSPYYEGAVRHFQQLVAAAVRGTAAA